MPVAQPRALVPLPGADPGPAPRVRPPDRPRELPEISEEFRRLADRSRDVVYRYDVLAREYVFWNEVGLLTFGSRHGQRPGTRQSVLALICPEDREKVRKAAKRSLTSEVSWGEVEYRIHRRDGAIRWMHDRWTVVRDAGKRPVAIEGVVRDDTARREAQGQIEERERELEARTRNLEDLIGALDVLLKRREEEKLEIRRAVLRGVRESVEPFLEKLRRTKLSEDQSALLDVIGANLADLVSPASESAVDGYDSLTGAEAQVADLVRVGKTTKEIARVLHLSTRTVESHRYSIRKKLGLCHSGKQLRARLAAREEPGGAER